MIPGMISVITPGRERTSKLSACISSVINQTYPLKEHLILSDNCEQFFIEAKIHAKESAVIKPIFVNTQPDTHWYKPARAAHVRNIGIQIANGEYVAFLDDDNTWEIGHLSCLMDSIILTQGAEASFSWRKLWDEKGTPYTAPLHPWTDSDDAARTWQELKDMGVYTTETNTMRDICSWVDNEVLCTVDTSEWLISTTIARKFPFKTSYTKNEIELKMGEDTFFGNNLLKAGVLIAQSKVFSLNYFLGGFSTSPSGNWDSLSTH